MEVGIQRQCSAIWHQFRHADKAGIGQGHRAIRITAHQPCNKIELVMQVELKLNDPALDEAQDSFDSAVGAPGEEAGFRDHLLTGDKWWSDLGEP